MRVVLKNTFRVKKPTRRLTEEDEASPEMFIQAWLSSPLPLFAAAPAPGAAPGAAPRGGTRDTLEPCFPGISEPNPHPEVLQAPGQWEIPPAGAAPAPLFTSRRRAQRPPDGFHPLLHLCLGIGHEHAGVLPCPALLSSHSCKNNTSKEEKRHIPVVFLVKCSWLRISPLKPRWLQRSFDISYFEICKEGTETAAAAAWQSFSSPWDMGTDTWPCPSPGVWILRGRNSFSHGTALWELGKKWEHKDRERTGLSDFGWPVQPKSMRGGVRHPHLG